MRSGRRQTAKEEPRPRKSRLKFSGYNAKNPSVEDRRPDGHGQLATVSRHASGSHPVKSIFATLMFALAGAQALAADLPMPGVATRYGNSVTAVGTPFQSPERKHRRSSAAGCGSAGTCVSTQRPYLARDTVRRRARNFTSGSLLGSRRLARRQHTLASAASAAPGHFRTHAVQQNLLMMFQRRLSCVGQIGGHRFLRSVDNPWVAGS
jgi:hypothetical protein